MHLNKNLIMGLFIILDMEKEHDLLFVGGNQRELAHQKNIKKSQEINKGKRKEDSLTTSQRKQR